MGICSATWNKVSGNLRLLIAMAILNYRLGLKRANFLSVLSSYRIKRLKYRATLTRSRVARLRLKCTRFLRTTGQTPILSRRKWPSFWSKNVVHSAFSKSTKEKELNARRWAIVLCKKAGTLVLWGTLSAKLSSTQSLKQILEAVIWTNKFRNLWVVAKNHMLL